MSTRRFVPVRRGVLPPFMPASCLRAARDQTLHVGSPTLMAALDEVSAYLYQSFRQQAEGAAQETTVP